MKRLVLSGIIRGGRLVRLNVSAREFGPDKPTTPREDKDREPTR